MIKSITILIKTIFLFHLVATSSLAMDFKPFNFEPLLATALPSNYPDKAFDLSRNSSLLAVGDNDGVIKILDAADGLIFRQWIAHTGDLWGRYKNIHAISISPDNTLVVSGSYDKTAKIYNMSNGTLCHCLNGHKCAIHDVKFSPDGTLIATAALDGSAKIWETSSGKMLHSLEQGQGYGVWSVDFSPDNAFVITTKSGSINIWNVVTGQHIISLVGHAPGSDITKALYSPDGTKILSASSDRTARIWDAATGALLHTYNLPLKADFVCFGPDSNQIMATGGYYNGLNIWDINTETIVQSFDQADISNASYNANNNCLLTASRGSNTAKIIDKTTGNLLHILQHNKPVRRADFVPFSNNIVTICEDNLTRIWVLPTDELSNPQKLAKKIYINTVKEYMNQLGQKEASHPDFIEFFTKKYPANELGYAAYVDSLTRI